MQDKAIMHGRVKEARWIETYLKGRYPHAVKELSDDWDSTEPDVNVIREVIVNREVIQGIARRLLLG